MDVQEQLALFYMMRFGAGAVFVVGALMFIYATFVPRKELIAAANSAPAAAE